MFPMRFAGVILCLSLAVPVSAQSRPGSLRLTIRDATDLTVAGAEITVTPSSGAPRTLTANEHGEAQVDGLAAGTYAVRVEFPGFTPVDIADIRIRSGAQTTRSIVLQIAGLAEEIDVLPPDEDSQLLAAFVEELTAEQLAALPDDPEELAQVLQQMVGENADIRINGFAGARLPPGAQIQDVRIRYDDASGSGNGGPRVEVRTRPGSGHWRNTFNINLRDDALNARNAFSGERPSGQTRQYSWIVNGPLVRNRTGLSVSIDRAETQEHQAIRAARPDGIYSALLPQPSTRTGASVELEHALTNTQELRLDVNLRRGRNRNQGVSEFDLPERAYSSLSSSGEIRVGHRATIRRQWVNNLRFQYEWQSSEAESASDALTIRVLDAFTTGGAQISGGRRSSELQIEDEFEFTIKKAHQVTVGATISGDTYSVDEVRNANGTFTFASLERYDAGLPTTYTQRTISPNDGYALYRFGWYVQENYRVNRSVMINATLRHDMQTHISDWTNFSPRVALGWTLPGRKTTLRTSIGVWPQFFESGLYEQTLWANGQQQRDIVIANPGYPDPFLGGIPLAAQPPSIVRAHPGIVLPYTRRATAGVNHTFAGWARLRATYSRQVGRNLFRSRDLNAPINRVRPDPSVRNITQLESTARSEGQSLEIDVSLSHRPRRLSANIGYTLGEAFNETDGALSLPPDSFDLAHEWGPSRQDVRHRMFASMNTNVAAGFRVNMNFRAQSAAPYNITTGLDENGDGQTNERPAGSGRNSGRGAATANLDMGIVWERSVGQRAQVNAQRGPGGPGGGGRGGNQGGGTNRDNGLFRVEIFARASNVLNLVNPQNFSGVLTSPFFGRPTSAAAARRLMVGMRAHF